MSRDDQPIYDKFTVIRNDGTDAEGGKHQGCRYIVVDIDHDEQAIRILSYLAKAYMITRPTYSASLAALRSDLVADKVVDTGESWD